MAEIKPFFSNSHRLPNMPEAARQLMESFAREDVALSELLAPIATDPVLTAKVLKMANAVRCSPNGQVGTLMDAALVLGRSALRNVALSACVVSAFPRVPRLDRKQFWKHALATGGYARWLSHALSLDTETAYFAGFMLRTGQVLMALSLPQLVADVEAGIKNPGMRTALEYARIGCTHSDVTAELGRRWRFPDQIVHAFVHASTPLQNEPFPQMAAVLCVAALLADASDLGLPPADALFEFEPQLALRLGLKHDWLAQHLPAHVTLTDLVDAMLGA